MENKQNAVLALKAEIPQLRAILALNARPGQDLATMAEAEIGYLEAAAITKPIIYECEPITVLLAVKTVLKQNLTLDPYAGLVYIKTRSINVGTRATPVYKTALEIQPSCNGLISIARQCGRILDIKRPEVTKDATGKVNAVQVDLLLPSIPAPRWETFKFDEDDIYRWQRASHNENGRNKQDANANTFNYANPNYTNFKGGIDPEFARAKAIRHALKKLGTNQSEQRANKIVIDPGKSKEIIVDKNADMQASEDEGNKTPYAEVVSEQLNLNSNNDMPKAEEL